MRGKDNTQNFQHDIKGRFLEALLNDKLQGPPGSPGVNMYVTQRAAKFVLMGTTVTTEEKGKSSKHVTLKMQNIVGWNSKTEVNISQYKRFYMYTTIRENFSNFQVKDD